MMLNGDDLPFVIHGGNGVLGERKNLARHQGDAVRLTGSSAAVGLQLFNTIFGQRGCFAVVLKTAIAFKD